MSNDTINVKLSTGAVLPYRNTISKKGNAYHAILKSRDDRSLYDPGHFGTKVVGSVVGNALPETATINGTVVKGVKGRTSGSPRDRVVFLAPVVIDGNICRFELNISQLDNGEFNVHGSLLGAAAKANARSTAPRGRGPATSL